MGEHFEKDLIKAIQNNPQRFGELYDAYFDKIFRYVFHRVVVFELAKDITSESFVKVYLNIGRFKWKQISIGSWIYRIANNEVNQYFRKKKYITRNFTELGINSIPDYPDPATLEAEKVAAEKELENHNEFRNIQSILRELDIKYQEVISLKYFDSKSIKEISEIVSKKEGTVKSLISRGLEKIRNKIKK